MKNGMTVDQMKGISVTGEGDGKRVVPLKQDKVGKERI